MGGSLMILLVLGLVITASIGYGAYAFFTPKRSARDRLEELTGGPKEEERDVVAERIAERIAKLAQPESEEEANILRLKLIQAGYRNKSAPR